MKLQKLFYAMTAGLMVSGLAACSSEEPVLNGANGDLILKAPKVIAYSGNQMLGNGGVFSRANAGDGDLNNQTWRQFDTDKLENVTDDERRAVLAAIAQKTGGSRISEETVFPWENYFLQDVISGQNGSFQGAGSNGTSSSSYAFEAWNKGADCRVQSQWYTDTHTQDYENYEQVTNSAHMNQYFQKVNADGSQTRINETTLMTDMTLGTYEEMVGKQFRWYINCHENLHWYEYITVQVDGNWYICFDFGCGHAENDVDGNPGKGAEHNDWDYNDWIIKITPAYPKGVTPPDVWTEDPTTPDPDPETPEIPSVDPEDPETPDTPVEVKHDNEVEINLHGVEKGEDPLNPEYYESHLSIHVRHATDVEVFIPIPANLYCPEDDMYIFETHMNGNGAYGGSQTEYTVTYPVADYYTVTLTVKLEEEGIRVTTDGITQEVIDYLFEKNGDGITFEVWNYFGDSGIDQYGVEHNHDAIDIETLINHLSKSTVRFIDDAPNYYINAFHYEYDGEGNKGQGVNPHDCTVAIIDEQMKEYEDYYEAWHLNNAPYNHVYNKKGVEGYHSELAE
ncbi:MAG: hypothetical protein J1F20_04715 [Muribaculaceae bacterium]|nr:hypothetical protein [Muribaculaceae bacterium]